MKNKFLKLFFTLTLFIPTFAFASSFSILEPIEDISASANPGEKIDTSITVTNSEKNPITIEIYGSDAITTTLGGIAFGDKNDQKLGLGKWIDVKKEITLEPESSTKIPFQIIIPNLISPGTYSGAIIISETSDKSIKQNSTGVIVTVRYTKKINIEIPGEKIFDFSLENFKSNINEKQNSIFFSFDTINKGNTIIKASGKINIFQGDKVIQSIKIDNLELQANSKNTVNYNWNNIPLFGNYKAVLDLEYGEFSIQERAIINKLNIKKEINLSFFSWKIAIPIITIIFFVILYLILNKILQKNYLKKCINYTVGDNENINEIAEKFGMKWQKLAKINKLKSPYIVNKGQTILVRQK